MKWILLAAVIAGAGCGQDPERDPDVDAKAPIVNPLAPGARSGAKPDTTSTGEVYHATPGMKTGVPK